jgi:hypothetical protein
MPVDIPEAITTWKSPMPVLSEAIGRCELVFSAVEMDKHAILAIESENS